MGYTFKGTADFANALAPGADVSFILGDFGVLAVNDTVAAYYKATGAPLAYVGCTIFGSYAGGGTAASAESVFIGRAAGYSCIGGRNIAIGYNAGRELNGSGNISLGSTANSSVTLDNTLDIVLGSGGAALRALKVREYNVQIGLGAGLADNNLTLRYHTYLGSNAGLVFNGVGVRNSFLGSHSGFNQVSGDRNTYVGVVAGYGVTTGSNNTVIGGDNYDINHTTGSFNTLIGAILTGYGNVSNTVIVADGNNNQAFRADLAKFATGKPIVPPPYTVAALPSASTSGFGAIALTSNGRRLGQGAAAGTGCPVWSDGTNWRTFYDNTTVLA